MKLTPININTNKKLNRKDTIFFIVYSYVRLSLRNEELHIIECQKEDFAIEYTFNRLFHNYRDRHNNIKEILKKTILSNIGLFSISISELDSLLETTELFYMLEYKTDIHGLSRRDKSPNSFLIALGLINDINNFSYPFAGIGSPFWLGNEPVK
ncbi:hypothetical protein HNQ80_002352 [Anaerosolibacter carboniphilus]|uniref:Uncharacterized protein n=1 Tax=Anaerosolibacter carboniphilus TaxID=1417629 RepID=A0A841KS76_9FIRM|nr:hypothetical protein [Anaerosolibacter carboniphilus]MBB6216253.1 hypothetical protein [Anaerosolibacter carboniphilus]